MKSVVTKIFPALGLIFLITSCASTRMYTTLDILRPAQVSFAPEVNNILIVDNSVSQPATVGHYLEKLNSNESQIELQFDSASIFCTASLRENLEEKGFFRNVYQAHNRLNLTGDYAKITPLTPEVVKSLCAVYHADAVLALNRLIYADKITEFTYENEFGFHNYLDVKIRTDWSIQYPTDKPMTYTHFTDSFTWQSSNAIRSKAANELPARYDALVDASLLTGLNVADRLIPRWEKEDRYFYNPRNKYMRQAMDSVVTRNWQAAILLWKKVADKPGSSSLKFKANNNIAIAYEILGDLDNAIKYCNSAINAYPQLQVFNSYNTIYEIEELLAYKKELEKRAGEIIQIKTQLGN